VSMTGKVEKRITLKMMEKRLGLMRKVDNNVSSLKMNENIGAEQPHSAQPRM